MKRIINLIEARMNIKEIKKAKKLTDRDIAKAFGYKTTAAYSYSSAKKRIEKGIEFVYNLKNQTK
jgi:hypothetical protein